MPSPLTRRGFVKATGALTTAVVAGFPTIVPASVFGKNAPSNRINVGAIGTGRISRTHDMPGVWQYENALIMAVCDVDVNRANDAKTLVNGVYAKKTGKDYDGVKVYTDHRELLQNKDIDAVLISTPDHWHAPMVIDAVRAGKDVYMQKPASLTISEGRAMADAVKKSGRIMQVGSQQRSWEQFRYAVELVRNGRIGKVKNIYIGLPGDPSGNEEPPMPVPATLNYDRWLGTTPDVYYTEKRVHPQTGYDRPGWLRCEQFGAGMITGWGSHHVDIAHWAMDLEHTGPVEIWGKADFPKSGLWNVHGLFETHALYENGLKMVISNDRPNGIRFEGTDGWLFVSRGDAPVTSTDPILLQSSKKLDASDPKLLTSVIGPNEFHVPPSKEHHGNWLESIVSRKQPIAPAEVGHRSCSTCLLHHMAMKLPRHLHWNPKTEQFKNDPEATAMLSRPQRPLYAIK
ncbi:Gfo/Idh/MocA family protein [Fibrella aquatilis]|uniref:Gfo/Idh/MocA family oxidoreductase n=1 Tax=Fibrella aquatilis TaxID=2817059 RepID=A0A939G569_9BACT|nr:Gfo/Idh/MocA family oxidoreductase [Fibrella aquatilis]MBO0931250.1 Gfo/Idh/MocA family oxidoreductase [Fibrella aquatilis]